MLFLPVIYSGDGGKSGSERMILSQNACRKRQVRNPTVQVKTTKTLCFGEVGRSPQFHGDRPR